MEKFNFGIAKVSQFIVIVFFALILSFYFGGLLLIPLAILMAIIDILTLVGLNGLIATIIAAPLVGWLLYSVYNIENLFQTLLDTGIKLYEFGIAQNKLFENIADSVKPASSPATNTNESAAETPAAQSTVVEENTRNTSKPA